MDTKLKHPVAALFFVMALSALAPAYHSGAALTEATTHVIPAAVEPPRSLKAVAVSHTSVRLAWSVAPGEVTRYEVERKLPDGAFSKVGETTGSECFFIDENLQADPTYIYRVRAVGGGTQSPYSNHAHIRIGDAVSFIPAGVRLDPDGKVLRESLKNNVGLWGAIDQEDEFPVFQPGDCLDGDFYVGIQLSHDLGDFNTAALWDASLEITMAYDGDSLWTKPLELDNGDQTFLATIFHDKAISCDPDYRFTVREKTANGTVPVSNVSLKVLLFEKEANGFSAGEPIVLAHHYNDIKSTVTWSHSREGTASYDLEWVFIAAHENFTGATADSAFKTKEPVRINTQDAFYPHHVFYPEGKVWYRVRAVGMDPDYPGHRINGNWNYGPDAGMAVANSNAGLNWQLQTSFAEGGKYKNMVQYLDGSLRQRQAVTNLNTMEQVLVGETKYDYEGREAVSVLPAPVESQSLAFRPNLNVFTATDPNVGPNTSSQREKFHYDNGSLDNSPLGTASGTGKYYSPANDMSVIHRDYLPDAEGFAYSQMTYTRDGTGRVAVQSGVGEKFSTDGGHSTRFYYGEASSEELIRLFGPNTGKASHYRKNMTVDPNGQTSIAYMDQEGRTVATALAGEPPRGIVDALESYRANQEAVTEDPIILPRVPAETERNPHEIREEALAAERERYHEEFMREEKLLREERYGTEAFPGVSIGSTGTGQMGLMANNLPTAKEYKALMDLYRATNGPSWTNRNGWQDADSLTVQSVAGWKGVAVNGNGNVIWLHLQNNNLTGTLPSTIVDLVHLTELVLYGNQLTGPLPDSIGNMAALTQLQLNNNQFTGGITPDIRRLANLKILFLQSNQLSDSLSPSLGSLGSLTHINLSNNGIKGKIPPSLGKLSNLVLMSLSQNNLTGPLPDSLGFLSSLTTLRLENNQLEGPMPSSIGNMGNLTEVLLYNNLIGGPIPPSLGKLSKLNKIELGYNKLSGPIPDSLGYLGNLTELHLNNNELTGAIPASMGNMKKLKRLLLSHNGLSGELPPSLGNLTELNQFTVYNNELGGTVPSSFGNLTKLTDLSLSYNNFSGTLPPSLNRLKELKTLRLEFNDFEGPLPSGLGQLDKLTLLDIGYNRFTGPLPEGIENLALTHLSLWNNYFTFEHLLPVKDKFPPPGSRFSPQRMTEIPKAYNVKEGETLTLSATADRDTDPLTEFRWYRGTQPVTPRSTASHTVVLENVSASDAGNYYYDSWNSGFPGLTLTSEPQSVQVQSPGWKSLTVDLMSHNRKEGNSSVLRKTLLNTVPNTPYSLSYELSGLGTELEGIGCSSCSFELEIILLDPEDKPVSLGIVAGNNASDSFSYRNSYIVDDCMVEQTEATVNIGGIVLEDIGDYTVVKELRLLSPTAAQAMAEIRNSPEFAGQLAALDSLYSSYGDCEFCTSEDVCPEAEEAIAQAVEESAAMDCENIREMIISDLLREQDSYTEQDIMAHELYCQYQNCVKDIEASLFETNTVRIGGWNAAGSLRQNMPNEDPFYKEGGSGVNDKADFITALNAITIGSYTGSIHQVTDPSNTAMYYNAAGQPDPVNGKHLLYTNLLDQRAEMGEMWYQQKLDAQRWMLYRNFYFETSRKIKLGIPAYANCNGSKEALEQMDRLPTTEEGMQEWMAKENILEPVDSIQVESILYMLVEGCGETFSPEESNSLYSHLEAYFNGNRMTNPFNLLLEEDMVSNPYLAAVEAIMAGKGCSLSKEDGYGFSNPTVCLRDSLVFIGPGQMIPTGGIGEERKIYITEKAVYEAPFVPLWGSVGQDPAPDSLKEEAAEGLLTALMAVLPNPTEYQSLLNLYNTTNGPGWNNNTGWRDAVPYAPVDVTQWYPKVEVDENGNVSDLNLSQNGLSGPLLFDNIQFAYLYSLELQGNDLFGQLPPAIANLGSLTHLNLSNNGLSGTLPQELGSLNNLTYLNISHNRFEGEIHFNPSSWTPQLIVNGNRFTFTDLLPQKNNFFSYTSYHLQDSVDVGKNILLPTGQTLVLSADIDRNTAPLSEFQWFKDGVAINTRSASGHTHTISNASSSHSGSYYYKIWNADLPGLTLTSRVQEVLVYSGQPVRICVEYATGNSQGGYGQPSGNPTMEMYSLQKTWTEIVASCVAENQIKAVALKDLAKEKLMESWLEEYYGQFDLSCLDDINEKFSYTFTPKEYHYTLYYYDQAGSLIQTVPPKGVHPMGDAQVAQVKAGTRLHPAHTLATRYRYNSRGQLVWQESPDAGESKFWYNKAGQLRLSQDARQAAANAYSYTKYDRQGRVTETGEMLGTQHLDSLKAKLDHPSFPDPAQYSRQDVTLTGYDRPMEGADPAFTQENLRSRVSWTAMAEKDAIDTVFTLYSYDAHGNVKALLQDLPGLGSKKTEYRYDLVSGNVNLVLYQYGRSDQFIHRYSYDADNRIEEVYTSTDGYVWNREARYFYYPHGPLARVELGEYNVQGLDYYYTLQGWLKGVNMPNEGDPGGDGGFRTGTDAFAFALGYYEGDYKPINPNAVVSDSRDKLWDRYRDTRDTVSAAGLYNGNISWMSTDLPGLGNNRMQAMVYGYDQLHRIVQARSLTEYETTGYLERNISNQPYDVDYSYDANGNLLTLQRRGSQTAVHDSLVYEYNTGTNRLRNTDPADGENYTYDEIGNLISDAEEGIDQIEWTPYGKVRAVIKDDDSEVHFRYDAAGNRIAKIASGDTTVYVRDASGNVMGIYKNDTLVEQSIYGSSRLGLMTAYSKPGYRTLGGKKYELSNHLGNVLAVVTDNINLDQDSTWANVVNMTDYYPFGLAMAGRTVQDSTYRYGFTGHEKDDEIKGSGTHYSFGDYGYDPKLGRRWNVDPLKDQFPGWSPYAYGLNNPLRYIDPDGKVPWDIIIKGQNSSSITIKTDLIDVAVNASYLGADFGGNYTLDGLDIVQSGLDIVGAIDPTGVADGINAGIYLKNGAYGDALLSGIGLIPYAGDAAKVPRIAEGIDKISDAIKAVHGNSKASQKVQHGYEIINNKGEVLEYGISGQKRSHAQMSNGGSPRINQKLKTNYGNDPNVSGRIIETDIPNRQKALDWEQGKVNDFANKNGGLAPQNQKRPTPNN